LFFDLERITNYSQRVLYDSLIVILYIYTIIQYPIDRMGCDEDRII